MYKSIPAYTNIIIKKRYSNYKENPSAEENNTFIDIEEDQEKRCKNVIEEVLLKNDIELTDIKKDVKKLKGIIVLLRDN